MQSKKCPVCGMEIQGSGVKAKLGGQDVTVCCEQCAKAAKEHPEKHANAGK